MTNLEKKRDFSYLVERAREERALAATCDDVSAAIVHKRLAAEYERRAGRALVDSLGETRA